MINNFYIIKIKMIEILIFVIVFGLVIFIAFYSMKKITPIDNQPVNNIPNPNLNANPNRRPPIVSNENQPQEAPAPEEAQDEEFNNNIPQNQSYDPNKKLTKKEIHKMEKKKAKEDQREFEREQRELKKLREEEREKEMKEREKKREEEKQKEEEIYRKLKEEQEEKERKIYEQYLHTFSVQGGGNECEDLNNENLINKFIEYIKVRKVVALDDLSGEFKLNKTVSNFLRKTFKFYSNFRIS